MDLTKYIISLVVLFGLLTRAVSQDKFPYKKVLSSNGTQVDLEQYRGKPMLVEVISDYCIVCFKKMPTLNALNRKFGEKVQIILIGDERNGFPDVVRRFQERYELDLVAGFDSVLFDYLHPPSFPYCLWIDKTGIILGRTTVDQVNESNLLSFSNGDVQFLKPIVKTRPDSTALFPTQGGSKILFGGFFYEQPDLSKIDVPNRLCMTEGKNEVQIVNAKIKDLVMLACFGRKVWYRSDEQYGEVWPFIEYEKSSRMDSILNRRISYYFKTKEFIPSRALQQQLRQGLKSNFNFNMELCFKQKECWVLTRVDKSDQFLRSPTAYKDRSMTTSFGGINMIALGIGNMLENIEYKTQLGIPIIDKTFITWPIDLSFKAVMTDFDEVRKALMEKGLILSKEKRMMQVVVLSERNQGVAE